MTIHVSTHPQERRACLTPSLLQCYDCPPSEILTRPRLRLAAADPSMKPSPGNMAGGQAAAEGAT
jgi:hypothetical protein